ncbi:hypothetical protein J2W40_003965 [Sphingobium xenophagum]|uniref:Uncharacterized protein n=1 Tax=Sphingobium xenophagum TaxID=121428 RepID=A0ABU1X7L3_SPHXE|nr:hypothetical protein [Sphingobium xenophagum]
MIRRQRVAVVQRQARGAYCGRHLGPQPALLCAAFFIGMASVQRARRCRQEPGVENMLETCADAFGRKRLGHARRPPGRVDGGSISSQARFSSLGAAFATRNKTNILIRRSNTDGTICKARVYGEGEFDHDPAYDNFSASLAPIDCPMSKTGSSCANVSRLDFCGLSFGRKRTFEENRAAGSGG